MKHPSEAKIYALYWLLFSIAGFILPLIVSGLVSIGLKRSITLSLFTHGGQFALYSLSMMMSTFYLILRPDANERSLPFGSLLGPAAVFISVGFLLPLFVLAILLSSGVSVATWLLGWPTIVLFALACVLTYLARLADNTREVEFKRIAPSSEQESEVDALKNQLGT